MHVLHIHKEDEEAACIHIFDLLFGKVAAAHLWSEIEDTIHDSLFSSS